LYLNCHTYYSLKYGTISPDELLQLATKNGVKELVLTDINNTSATMHMLREMHKHDVRVIAGIDFRNALPTGRQGSQQSFIGIAKNNEGFAELNRFLSEHNHAQKEIPPSAPDFEHVFIIYPYGKKQPHELKQNEYVGLRMTELSKLLFTDWKNHQDKLVALHPVTFKNKKDFNAHRILRAIDNNALLSQLPKTEEAKPEEMMMHESDLVKAFEQYPTLIENTRKILASCSIHFEFNTEHGHNNLQTYTGNEDEDFELMRKLCYEGLPYRYQENQVTNIILDRIESELKTIRQKGFVSYFLVAWDILNYARSKGYFYVGRGSGANSIVSYLLKITDVDPVELDLYFERFINLFRKNPPDFDIDFSWKDREDVTRYMFEEFNKKGDVVLLGAYSTFQSRSVIREIGKVFGVPDHEIKRLQQTWNPTSEIEKLILIYSNHIHDFPSHLTVHSAGIIISDKSIYNYTATFMPPKGFPTTHFDMHIAEDIGLYKFDILGQRGLAKVKDALAMIRAKGEDVDIHNIALLKEDQPSNDQLKVGMAIGCFYVESPAMRMLLRKLEVQDYLGLVAASSVIRPGVAQSGMMREYILRHRDKKRREWAKETYPVLYEIMPETYGVMVYQEDVIKVAHYFAKLTLAEADVLRRGMSGKYRSREEFQEVKKKFFSNCKDQGVDQHHIQEVWDQIESFAGYAFAKGHSASYAVESYQCLYLKAYYPLEFLVATVNNGGGFYSREVYLHEARKYGAEIHLPCINTSDEVAVLKEKNIYLGLGMIATLNETTISAILQERNANGPFVDFRNFIDRVPVSLEQITTLLRINAFRFTGKDKKELLWDALFLLGKTKKTEPTTTLFEPDTKEFTIPPLWHHPLQQSYDEMELLGFTVTAPPFALLKEIPKGNVTAAFFPFFKDQLVTLTGYLVHIKNTTTKDGRNMHFGTFIDLHGEWIDTVMFPPVAEKNQFSGPGCYQLHGKVVEEFGFMSLEIIWQKRIPNISLDDDISTRLKQVKL
jgi:DNA polymerase III subunit alpha